MKPHSDPLREAILGVSHCPLPEFTAGAHVIDHAGSGRAHA